MKKRSFLSKWLLVPLIGATIVSALTIGLTGAYFNDLETSTGNDSTAWTPALWTQTSESDFSAGVLSNVDTATSPGDVLLSAPVTSYSPTVNSGNWTNGANGYSSDNTYATYTPSAILSTRSPAAYTGAGWTNPANAYASDTSYATQTSGGTTSTYGTYGFSVAAGNPVTQVRVRADAFSTGTASTTSKNPTANTNGTLPWTNPANGYTSNNSYATVSPTYGSTTSNNPTTNTNGTNPWTNPGNAYSINSAYATAAVTAAAPQNSPSALGTGTWTNAANAYSQNAVYASASAAASQEYRTYGFSIPANATITAVSVDFYGYRASGTAPTVNLQVSGNAGSSYYATHSITLTTSNASHPTAVTSDATWTPSMFNSDQCWVKVNYVSGSKTAYLDWLPVTVTYSTAFDQVYSTFGITDPGTSSTITKVEVGYDSYASVAGQKLNLYDSVNAGSSWSAAHLTAALATSNPGTYTYVDITADNTWTWTLLNNFNFQLKMVTSWVSGAPTFYTDALVIRVTYDDRRPYDQIFGTFGITDPGSSPTITKVELGYEAFATATGKLDLYTSANGGSSWSSVHTTANLATSDPGSYTYVDVTADQTWTWTLLNDTNFKYKVVTNFVSGTPAWSIDALEVRVTITGSSTDDQIRVAVSWDGGTNWSGNYAATLTGSKATYWFDVTSATTWNATKINDTNLKVRVDSVTVGDTSIISLDWLPVEVTYYDATVWSHTYGTYGISLTGDYITKVEVGIEAYAASSEKVELDVTWNNSTYSSRQTSGALPGADPNSTTWFDFTSATTWTPTTLNNTNFKVRIWYLNNGAFGQVRLDCIPVRVTYRLPSGTIASQVLDTTVTSSGWDGLAWDRTLPGGTGLTFAVRASDTSFAADAGSPTWTAVGGTSPVITSLPTGRYKQWQATLTTTSTSTPTLSEVRTYYYGG